MTTVTRNPLASISCFSGLSPEALAWVLGALEERSFARGQVMILEGDPWPGLFVLKSGAVKLYRVSPEGEEQIVRIIRQGGCFECAPLFDKGPNPVSATALEACEVHFLPASDFQALMSAHPDAVLGIVSILAMRLRSLLNMVEDFSFRPVASRLAKLLLQLGQEEGELLVVSPSLPLSQQDLACMLGCSRQLVNKSLRTLVRDGIIGMEGRRIVILKSGALREIGQP
ncbi:MAG: Crp/Fnr family transcriptional regulator [Dehalococcoidia bacterium]